jgi:hypothetical protein
VGPNLVIRSVRVRARQRVGMSGITVVLRPTSAKRLIKISQGSGIIETDRYTVTQRCTPVTMGEKWDVSKRENTII